MKTRLSWSCVLNYSCILLILGMVVYMVCFYRKPTEMSKRVKREKNTENYEDANCWEISKICRMQHGESSTKYCECMKAMGCERDWCKCLTVVNACAAKSKTREEFCKCINKSECANKVECKQDTNLDCGQVQSMCQTYYPDSARACTMYYGCKPDSDPICANCKTSYAADPFYMASCQLCRGCVANEAIYGDRKREGKLPKCDKIPEYVPPKKKLTPQEQEMADYLRINRQCGTTDAFNFPGTSFADEMEKRCFCCVGMSKYDNKYDSCNCAGVDCVDEESTQKLCQPFMDKYNIQWKDVPSANVTLGEKEKKALKKK